MKSFPYEGFRIANEERYSVGTFAEQVVALLNHLNIRQSVVGGTSPGANPTLETAHLATGRVRGMSNRIADFLDEVFA